MTVAKNKFSDTRRAKFEREVNREAREQARHRVRTRFDAGYRAVCSCRWAGESRASRAAADQDGRAHRESVS